MATTVVPMAPATFENAKEASTLAAELLALSERLHQVASAATVGAEHEASRLSIPRPEKSDCATNTELSGVELSQWETAEALLAETEASVDMARQRIDDAQRRREESALHCSAIKMEIAERQEEASSILAQDSIDDNIAPYEAEAQARRAIEVSAEHEAAEADSETREVLAADQDKSRIDEEIVAELQQEIAKCGEQQEKALAEASELVDNTRTASEANVARRAMASTEAAESQGDLLQEEEARLKEEVSTLKFSLKETKRFQHKRVQELNTQVQKLEKQKQRLEEQQVARIRTEEESDGQRARLQQLNEKLKAQVHEALQERDAKLSNAGALREELTRLQAQNALKSEKMQMGQEHLDELAEENGAEKREVWKLRQRVNLISQQVDALEQTSVQTRDQWQETEESLKRANDEKGGAERKAEILKWKLQVAETQLGKGVRTSGRGTGVASDSGSAGYGPTGGDDSPSNSKQSKEPRTPL